MRDGEIIETDPIPNLKMLLVKWSMRGKLNFAVDELKIAEQLNDFHKIITVHKQGLESWPSDSCYYTTLLPTMTALLHECLLPLSSRPSQF